MPTIKEWSERLHKGGEARYHDKLAESHKLFVRKRIQLLCDEGTFVEDGLYANCLAEGLPADGVLTGLAKIHGRPVALMANDSTIKAGSWGARTVEKILRIQETAARHQLPLFYLVDSAGARITDQVEMFPGRRGAGKIFYHQSLLSGKVPQICLLFGPSAAGGAYIPAFCDIVIMVEGNASMYLGSPRMAEAVIGEKVTLEEMGGARMHCSVSGVGDFLVKTEEAAIELAKKYFSYLLEDGIKRTRDSGVLPERPAETLKTLIPESHARVYDMKELLKAIVDRASLLEIKELYAKELITAFGRIQGRSVGIIANQPMVKGGVLFAESANKAARFIQICSAYSIPLLFVADVPGFMIGSKVEKEGIIRAGAKMIYAMSNAQVPKISLVVRKAYGAGLYAMCGPAFDADCVLALPTAQIAVMGPEPAINAVYYNKLQEMEEGARAKFKAEKIAEYQKDVDIYRLAGELVIDHMIDFSDVRDELAKRFQFYAGKKIEPRQPGILPM
jgi:methylmalonyl-CoA decarboxylase subunit alpha